MKGILVRVGIDSSYGKWNAPVDVETSDYLYVPIPENSKFTIVKEYERKYCDILGYLKVFASKYDLSLYDDLVFPKRLASLNMHLDPDFKYLTYGDNGLRRGRGAASLESGDFIAFYAGLRPTRPYVHRLVYAIIGFYQVEKIEWARNIQDENRDENAHTRKQSIHPNDIIIYANPENSGRLKQCIPIGEYRNKAYRVQNTVLDDWGGLEVKNGYIHRSINPPFFSKPKQFLKWFEKQDPELMHSNF